MKTPSPAFLAAAVAALAAACGLAGLVALNTGGAVGAGPVRLGLSHGYSLAADRLAAGGRPEDLAAAEDRLREALALSPMNTAARLSLAGLERDRLGYLSAAAEDQLALSYRLLPVDPRAALRRSRLALENWPALDPSTRQAALYEIETVHRLHGQAGRVEALLGEISDPAGRVAAALLLRKFQLARDYFNSHD